LSYHAVSYQPTMLPSPAAVEAVTHEELTRAAELFDVIKQLRLRLTAINEEVLDRAFETHITGVLDKLEKRLDSLQDPLGRRVEVIMAKHGLCDAAFQQIILLCQGISPALGDVLKQLRGMHSEFFSELQQVSDNFVIEMDEQRQYCDETKAEMENIEQECQQLMETINILDKEAEENHEVILDLRHQLREALTETNNSKFSGRQGNASTKQNTSSGAVDVLPAFNTTVTPDVRGRTLFENMTRSDSREGQGHLSRSGRMLMASLGTSSVGSGAGRKEGSGEGRFMSATASSKGHSGASPSVTLPTQVSFGSSAEWLLSFRLELQQVIDADRVRSLTLNECRDMIASIYETKNAANARAAARGRGEGVLPGTPTAIHTDTMEMHVYRRMEKKYGLRSLAVEHAAMFLTAVRLYAESESDIAVFYKIFCNDVEEEFREVQEELKKSIKDLLVVSLMNKYPNKDQAGIDALVRGKIDGVISEQEYEDIVNYLYNQRDATTLRLLLRGEAKRLREEKYLTRGEDVPRMDAGEMKQPQQQSRKASVAYETKKLGYERKVPPSMRRQSIERTNQQRYLEEQNNFDLPYSVFLKCVLDFQLASHEKYIAGFKHAFRHYDDDGDGVLTSEQFRQCYIGLRAQGGRVAGDEPSTVAGNSSSGKNGKPVVAWAPPSPGAEEAVWTQEEEEMFLALLAMIDPAETDRVTFSAAASFLNKIGKRASGGGGASSTGRSRKSSSANKK